MDWNKVLVLGSQTVVFVGLLVAVCMGHNSVITDALLAVSGSIVGGGLITTVKLPKLQPRDITDAGD